ncbi:MAG: Aminopeptidase [Labilithrix sp.]|nr:Aminopeptidase [Labilithrix sp.]
MMSASSRISPSLLGLDAGTFITLIGRDDSNRVVRSVLDPSMPDLHRVAVQTASFTSRLFPDLVRSDHYPFWEAELPAVLWTDTGNFRNPNYHRGSDTPETLDYAFMSRVADLVEAVVVRDSGT